jgi:hypothetical protein
MTAMSAQSASETPSTANSLRDLVASLRTVVVPGSPATYANRAALRAIGLRWDPVGRRWHGTTTTEQVRELRERLGLEVRCFGVLEPHRGLSSPRPPAPALVPSASPSAVRSRDLVRRLHDGSRTRAEARVVYRDSGEDAEEVVAPCRRFTVFEITSGLVDDSREADEKQLEQRLRDLRARVKFARAVVSTTPGLADTLARDWQRAARFYARFGVTETMVQHGVPSGDRENGPASLASSWSSGAESVSTLVISGDSWRNQHKVVPQPQALALGGPRSRFPD